MTNLVFIEHKNIPKDQARAIKEDLQAYAISVALKFPTETITEKQKIKVARTSVKSLLKQFDLSTKNLGTLIHDEVTKNLNTLYVSLKRKSNYNFLLEMIQIMRFLRRNHPRKYRKLFKTLKGLLNTKQHTILSLYLNSKPKKAPLTYAAIGKVVKSTPGPISGDVKKMVYSLNKVFKAQRLHGR
jgi:hypothetical protein